MQKQNKKLGLDRPFFICPGIPELPGRKSNFPTLTFYHAFVKLSRVKFLVASNFAAVRPGVKSRRLSNFVTSYKPATIVKF